MDRRAHREMLARFGFSHKDHARLRAMARRTREGGFRTLYAPWELDAPYAALAVRPDLRGLFSGQMIGTLEGCAILVWPRPQTRLDLG